MPILAATAFATKQSRQPSLLPRRSAGSRSRESSSDGRYGPPRSKAQRQGSARNQGAKPRAEIEGGSVKAGGGSAPGAGGGRALEGGSGRGLNRPKAGGGSAPTFYISPSTSGVMDQMTDDERPKVSTVAELFAYVSAAWDTGGKSYCATRTWFGTGLQDAFERLATQERVSEAERPDIVRQMIAAMPACRRCGCVTPRRGNGRRAPGARVRSWGRGEGRSMPINVT